MLNILIDSTVFLYKQLCYQSDNKKGRQHVKCVATPVRGATSVCS